MSKLICDIVTPVAKLYSDDASLVVVPGVEGEMGFLEGHEPLVTVLSDGVARVHSVSDGDTLRFVLQGGYVEVTGSKVIILADRALPVSEVDAGAARESIAAVESQIAELAEGDVRRITLASDIAWYRAQIAAVE